MAKTEEIKEKKKLSSHREVINLKEFMILDGKKQDEEIRRILDIMYESEVKVTQKLIDKVLNVAFDSKDNVIYLPSSLAVEKEGAKLLFYFRKKKAMGLFLLFLLGFLFIGGFATYTGVQYLGKALMNQDLDGDGIADLNIDINDDGICDINCDTNRDGKPDRNIDFHGNRKPIFNAVLEDGTLFNKTNQDIDGDGVCDINCDTNDDGWPDLNIDYDGDGVIDFDRDIDGDGIKDLDLDLNGDGVCDINCDTDKDNKCDMNCTNVNITNNGSGTSSSSGDGGNGVETPDLVVIFEGTQNVSISNIYPDDQPQAEANKNVPDLKFTVENTTDITLYYRINWFDVTNTFLTDNFWFSVRSDNNGYRQGWSPAPHDNTAVMASQVAIAPHTKQSYTVSFTLHGTGSDQNIDQGKRYSSKVMVELIPRGN